MLERTIIHCMRSVVKPPAVASRRSGSLEYAVKVLFWAAKTPKPLVGIESRVR